MMYIHQARLRFKGVLRSHAEFFNKYSGDHGDGYATAALEIVANQTKFAAAKQSERNTFVTVGEAANGLLRILERSRLTRSTVERDHALYVLSRRAA